MKRPESLTYERAEKLHPTLRVSDDWQRKRDAGELPDGFEGLFGMLEEVPPQERMTREEAEYILWVRERETWRGLAEEITGDCAQPIGEGLERYAKMRLQDEEKTSP